jgi:toxin ParE1/3/4
VKRLLLDFTNAGAADILEQADWYEGQADAHLGKRWERSVYLTLSRPAQYPRSGALCRFRSADLSGIRQAPVAGFPKHSIFYRVENDHLVVIRVVHGARDLESLF